MKKSICSVIITALTLHTFAQQNVGIRETAPDSKLSVKGNLASAIPLTLRLPMVPLYKAAWA